MGQETRRHGLLRAVLLERCYKVLHYQPSVGGCASTAPIAAPISGQSFLVLTINGRPLPATFLLSTRGTCGAHGANSISLVFSSGGSFGETIGTTESTALTITGSYTATQTSSVVLVNGRDTATVTGDTLRVRLSGANCGGEELVALRRG